MTLEERAKAIADKRGLTPGSYYHRAVEAFALQMLREAVDQALKKSGDKWPSHGEMA
jgi:hypothetical protein